MALTLRYAARSDVGVVRPGNEDSGFAGDWLLAVADGMGGHAAGELASSMAVATFAEVADTPMGQDEALSILGDAIDLTGERIATVISDEPQFQGMGTTFTGLAWLRDRLALVHVGDSRAYRYRDGELEQLTKDHTYVQTLVDSGQITPEEAATHPRRNLIMRAIDGIHGVEPDLSIRDLQSGDRFLICSDGLTGVVSDERIARVLSSGDPTGVVTRLVELALEGGAPDNVTVVVADVVEVADDDFRYEDLPVVVGAAGESRNRRRLPNVPWPVDEQPDPNAARNDGPSDFEDEAPEDSPVEHKRRWRRPLLLGIAAVVMIFAAIGAALLGWISSQWYVGSYQGNVAIYQGVPGSIGPVPLQRLSQETGIAVDDLPVSLQQRVESSILVESQEQAISTVAELDSEAQACGSAEPPAGCPDSAADEEASGDSAEGGAST